MAENFEVAQGGPEGELPDETRHEVVAAQLRGEAKAAGKGPEAVIAAVSEELAGIGLEPDSSELHRRYEEIDPDVPELADEGDRDGSSDTTADTAAEAPADTPVDSPRTSGADGPVAAGTDAGRDHAPVDDAPVDDAPVDDADGTTAR